MSTFERVCKVLAEVLLWEEDDITESTKLTYDDEYFEEDGEDKISESMEELMDYLGQEFGVDILGSEGYVKLKTVGDLVQYIEDLF